MGDVLFNILAFLVAIGVLVAVHEFGHFWVARRLGVKVLRFSLGFGRPLWRRYGRDGVEYVVAAIPLGGYVRMLDEREGPVAADQVARAFNRQRLAVRSAIVAAGPIFNFLFAIVAFWIVLVGGETGLRPLIGKVEPASIAERAGLRVGDELVAVNGRETPTWSLAVQELAAASVSDGVITLSLQSVNGEQRTQQLDAGAIGDPAESQDLLGDIGLAPVRPQLAPIIGAVVAGEAAAAAGLRGGDRIVAADGRSIGDWGTWVDYVQAHPGTALQVQIERDGKLEVLTVTPAALAVDGRIIGRIGASNRPQPELFERYRVVYRMNPLAALPAAVEKTWNYSWLTLRVVGRILTGQASINNLSGPITIADAAGKTAEIGAIYFVKFLAIISISLGVLNLLPVPVLDGGHLAYFLIEAVRGAPLSEVFMERAQRVGLALLLGLMSVAFYVDFQRYLG